LLDAFVDNPFFTFDGFFFNSLGTIVEVAAGNGKADSTILFLVETFNTTFFNFDSFFFVLLESITDATLGGGLLTTFFGVGTA
jgi:hypothetical protein